MKMAFEVVFLDQPVEVNVGEGSARIGAPVAEQPLLDVFGLQRLAQQRVVPQIDHARRQVQRCVPVACVRCSSAGSKGLPLTLDRAGP